MTESSSWHAIVSAQSPHWDEAALPGFDDPIAEARAVETEETISPLTDLAVIRVTGADAVPFLQGQLSNDLERLGSLGTQLAAYCTPKGRMLALFRVIRLQEDLLLLVPRELLAPVLKRLKMFVMRSKVVLDDKSAELLVLGVCGGRSGAQVLRGSVGALPEKADGVAAADGASIVRLPSVRERYLVIAEPSAMAGLWTQLSETCRPVGPTAWRLLDVRDALPQVWSPTQEAFVPQMANLDLVNGLSFNKGCYPGQEIVARMHFLGTLKRRMYRFAAQVSEPPEPGSEVRDEAGSLVGEVVTSARAADGSEGLAVLQIERALSGGLRIDGAQIQVTPPPYSLEQ